MINNDTAADRRGSNVPVDYLAYFLSKWFDGTDLVADLDDARDFFASRGT